LEDLNRDLRATYAEPVDASGVPRPTITFYGQNLEVKFVPTREDAERLLAVFVSRVQPSLLNKRRQQAVSMPFLLSLGDGSAAALIEKAYAAFDLTRQEEQAVTKVHELFELGRFMLERQRNRLVHLRVRCRVADAPNGRRRRGGRQRRRPSTLEGNIQLKVTDVRPWDNPDGGSDDLLLRWADGVDEKTSFSVRVRRVGRFRGFDAGRQLLSVRWEVPIEVDGVVDLEFKDVALETSLNRQEAALRSLEVGTTTNPRLRELLIEPSKNHVDRVAVDDLIQEQLSPPDETRQLVERMLGAQELFLLQGPPGTGKTTLIAEFVGQVLRRTPRAKVLLVSQTHDAVDNALERLEELAREEGFGWRLVRDLSAEAQASGRRGFESSFRAWIDRVRARSHEAWGHASATLSADQRTIVGAALDNWREKLDQATDIREDFASSVQVMATTCLRAPAVLKQLREGQFDWAVVDEAAKATATEVLVPMVAARRALLVGDHRQLPPFLDTETTNDLRSAGYDVERARRSLFEELFASVPPTNRASLRVQYRMHRSIGSFVGDLYYRDIGGLETGVPDEARTIDVPRLDSASRLFWVDVDGRVSQDGTSSFNVEEMQAVKRVVESLFRQRATPLEVAVIAPYLAQVRRIREMAIRGAGTRVTVATVDAFQGRQVDVVVYSFVKDNPDAGRFVSDPRRLNVAFSRCKRVLILVGSIAAARRSAALAPVVQAIPSANIVRGGF
jgi:serine/threonine-protein kinase